MQPLSKTAPGAYRQTMRTGPPASVTSRQARLRDAPCRRGGLVVRRAGGPVGGDWAETAAVGGCAIARVSRRNHGGSRAEIDGGLFMTTVPSDVRVHAATGTSPQQRTIAMPVLPILPLRGEGPSGQV